MLKVCFVGVDNSFLEIGGASLRHCLELSQEEKYKKFEPLYFKTTTDKLFYFDKNTITTYLSNWNMSDVELIEHCGCDGLFRNSIEINSDNGTIDKGALWKMVNQKLILIDEENFLTADYDNDYFEKVA